MSAHKGETVRGCKRSYNIANISLNAAEVDQHRAGQLFCVFFYPLCRGTGRNCNHNQLAIGEHIVCQLAVDYSFVKCAFNIAFVEQLGDEQNGQTRPNELKMEILDYVLKISNLKDVREVYLKLNELILKLEHFRVMVRNVASHKSVLTQRAIENGLNICITQETSIFNLLDELFGYYLEKQMYIAEVKKYAKNSKTKLTEDEVNNLVNSVMDETI